MNNPDSATYGYFMTGGMHMPEFWAAFTVALIGQVFITAWNVRNGIKKNPHTSNSFNIRHFGWDSAFRILCSSVINLIAIYIYILIAHLAISDIPQFGQYGLIGSSFFVGMGIDKWIIYLFRKRDEIG